MNIFKAIKQEKKANKHFYIIMISLAIILPLAIYLTALTSWFYLTYLFIMEFLIMIAIIRKINISKLSFNCSNNKLKFSLGLSSRQNLVICDKIVLVHTNKMEEDMEIILISSVKTKSKYLKPVLKSFCKKYPLLVDELKNIKRNSNNQNQMYYYQVIKRGGLNKYMLLDTIYKNCVKAIYTEECIQNIKIARGQTLM